eukprot:588146_1
MIRNPGPQSRSLASSVSQATSVGTSVSQAGTTWSSTLSADEQQRPSHMRFVVGKEKRGRRDSTRMLQVVPSTRTVLIFDKKSQIKRELPHPAFFENGTRKVVSNYKKID